MGLVIRPDTAVLGQVHLGGSSHTCYTWPGPETGVLGQVHLGGSSHTS